MRKILFVLALLSFSTNGFSEHDLICGKSTGFHPHMRVKIEDHTLKIDVSENLRHNFWSFLPFFKNGVVPFNLLRGEGRYRLQAEIPLKNDDAFIDWETNREHDSFVRISVKPNDHTKPQNQSILGKVKLTTWNWGDESKNSHKMLMQFIGITTGIVEGVTVTAVNREQTWRSFAKLEFKDLGVIDFIQEPCTAYIPDSVFEKID